MVCWFLTSFVSATLQVLLEKLADAGIKACESVSDADDKLKKLRRTVLRVQSEINNAEERQIGDQAWQALLQDLEEVAYDADDLLDEISIQVSSQEGGKNMLKDLVSKALFSLYKHTSAPNMSSIQTKLDGMLGEIESRVKDRRMDMLVTELQSSSLNYDESNVLGRETDKRKIVNMLVGSEDSVTSVKVSGSNVFVIPIVGMIGVGKTSLAQLVYNYKYEDEMRHPFDLKMWVSVSKDFDVIKLTKSVIEAANVEGVCFSNLESLHRELARILRDKKFLLVLDDLWNEKRDEWDRFFEPLKYSLKGSKIVVTTRSHVVSSMVGTDGPYHLKCLSDDDCWLLLKREAFGDVNLKIDAMWEDIGMKIARKCKGFPLTAKSVGRLLRCGVDEDAWNAVLRSKIWELPEIQTEVIPALRSTCDHLPSHLKQCFAYCSMFPQSYQFEKDKTVRMWMGEGFIAPTKERKMVEEVGAYYFDQLFLTSFFQREGEKYKMQGAVHDLAQSVFGEKFSRIEEADDLYVNVSTRHLSIICEKIPAKTFEATYKCKSLRTFLVFGERGTIITEVPHSLFMKLGRLRVLDLSSTQIEELTKSVGNLKHLRFLDLSNTLLKWLPETIQDLGVLQTLRLVNCSELLSLPKGTSRLKGLRHLELDGNNQLTSMPNGIGILTGLHTISEFVVGPEDGQMKELKYMNNIRGTLRIKQLEKVRNPQEALEANLANKMHLEELDLQWTSVSDARNDEYVLDKLMTSPHENLKKLTLGRYGGRMFPKWVSSSQFSKLSSIFFNECKNCGFLPPLGQLPKLKSLKIIGMHELIKVDHTFLGVGDFTGFPSLEILELRDLPKLEGWVGVSDRDMASLREFTISECPEMVVLPSLHYLRSLQKLEFESCTQISSFSEQRLASSVESLVIINCPMLEERCKRNGDDWTMIEHIPYIEVDYENLKESQP